MLDAAARARAGVQTRGGARSMPAMSPLGVAALAFLALYAGATAIPEAHRWLGGLAYHIPPLAALVFLPRVLLRTRGSERLGWACVALLLVAWDGAEWVYSYHSLVLDNEAPIPSMADGLYYLGYAAFIAGLPLLGRSDRALRDPRSIVDATIVVTVFGTLSWHFLLGPLLPAARSSTADLVLFGYPLLDLGLAAALIATFYGSRDNYAPHVRWLIYSVAILLVADTLYILTAGETVAQASLLDIGWLASYLCIAAALRARVAAPAASVARPEARQSLQGLVLPYIAFGPLLATAFYERISGEPGGFVAGGTAIAAILIMVRQWLTLLENHRLYRVLETRAAELAEQAVALEELRRRAAHQANHDELTGLLNRRAWFAAARIRGGGCIALFDVDGFKGINDRHGHPYGDRVLQSVAQRLKRLLAGQAVVGRVGGEEFAVLFACEHVFAMKACRRVVEDFATVPIELGKGETIALTMSVGVARWSWGADPESSLTATYEIADRALYMAKQTGRNRAVGDDQIAA